MSNLLLVKPEKLDKIQKPIDEAKYFQWKETLLDCANQKADWSTFTKPTSTWLARNEDRTRGEADAAKQAQLNSYITYVATFALGSLLLGPEFLESIKKIIKLGHKSGSKDYK